MKLLSPYHNSDNNPNNKCNFTTRQDHSENEVCKLDNALTLFLVFSNK